MKLIRGTSRFDNSCDRCGGPIYSGETIYARLAPNPAAARFIDELGGAFCSRDCAAEHYNEPGEPIKIERRDYYQF